jgi:hypothetical protein
MYLPPGRLSYISVPGDHPLLEMTMGQLIDTASEKFGDKEAVVISNPTELRKTYVQLKQDVTT